jgi:plastocyanin
MRGGWSVAAVLAAAVVAVPAPAVAAPRVHTNVMDKMKFGAVPAGIRKGDVILWVNRDMFRHTATARDGSFNIDLPAAKSGRTVVSMAGAIDFYCKFHPGMKGRMVVGK